METKRQEITTTALNLFCQYGIKSISMDDIARELGMSKKTLYLYINDKNELVKNAMDLAAERDIELLSVFKREGLNAIEQFYEFKNIMEPLISQYQPTIMYDLKKYYPVLLQEFQEKKTSIILDAYLANLKKGKLKGYYNEDIDEQVIAKILLSYHLYTFDDTTGIFTSSELRDLGLFAKVFRYHFRGICTPQGIEEVERLFNSDNKEQ